MRSQRRGDHGQRDERRQRLHRVPGRKRFPADVHQPEVGRRTRSTHGVLGQPVEQDRPAQATPSSPSERHPRRRISARAMMATIGTSAFWLPTAEKTRATNVAPDARRSTIHDVTDRSNAVEPSGDSAVASQSPLAIMPPSTTPKSPTTPAKSTSPAPSVARTGRTGGGVCRPAGSCARFSIGLRQGSWHQRRARKRVRRSPGIVPGSPSEVRLLLRQKQRSAIPRSDPPCGRTQHSPRAAPRLPVLVRQRALQARTAGCPQPA
jgi:hypothetical protein